MIQIPRGDVAVIGLGCFGRSVALALRQRKQSVIGIDRDPTAVDRLAGDLDHLAVIDATSEAGLRKIGIGDFETAVVAIGRDFESSALATLTLSRLGVSRIICKALSERHQAILLSLGASSVILPECEMGYRLADTLTGAGAQTVPLSQLRPAESSGALPQVHPGAFRQLWSLFTHT